MPATRLLPWAILTAMVVFAAATYPGLPEQVPSHIDLSGEVTRSSAKSFWSWFLLPLIAVLSQGLMTWLTFVLRREPKWFNFPDKERFLRLPKEYHPPVIEWMQLTMDAVGIILSLTMLAVQWLLWRSAIGEPQGLGLALILVSSVMTGPIVLILTTKVTEEVERQEKRWREATGGTGR